MRYNLESNEALEKQLVESLSSNVCDLKLEKGGNQCIQVVFSDGQLAYSLENCSFNKRYFVLHNLSFTSKDARQNLEKGILDGIIAVCRNLGFAHIETPTEEFGNFIEKSDWEPVVVEKNRHYLKL